MQAIYCQQHHTTRNLPWRHGEKPNRANKRKTKFHIHVEIGGYVTLRPASCRERSVVPEELQQKALSCYVGTPTETPPAYKCKQMQGPRLRVKKGNLDRAPSDSSSSRCLHQIVRFPLWPGALLERVGTGNCKTAHTQTGIRGQLSRMAGCKVGWVITLVSLRNKQDTELEGITPQLSGVLSKVWLVLCRHDTLRRDCWYSLFPSLREKASVPFLPF